MYYEECTKAYAIEFIKEITEYSSNDGIALDLIQQFLNGEITTTEIEDMFFLR